MHKDYPKGYHHISSYKHLPPPHTKPRTGGTAVPRIRERLPTGFEISRTASRVSKVCRMCCVQLYEVWCVLSLQTPAGMNNKQSLPTVSHWCLVKKWTLEGCVSPLLPNACTHTCSLPSLSPPPTPLPPSLVLKLQSKLN